MWHFKRITHEDFAVLKLDDYTLVNPLESWLAHPTGKKWDASSLKMGTHFKTEDLKDSEKTTFKDLFRQFLQSLFVNVKDEDYSLQKALMEVRSDMLKCKGIIGGK